MPTPFILLFGLTVATCVIAYWSDNLGKKLGKKRISLLGLRPRQTATLITMASSWGIMLLTLAVLLRAWPPLYDALVRYDRVNESNKRARTENKRLSDDNTRLSNSNAGLQASMISLKQQANALAIQARRSRARVAQMERRRRQSEAKLRTAQRGERAAKRRAVAAQKSSARAQRRFVQAQRSFGAIQKQLRQNQERLKNVNASLKTRNASLEQARAKLARATDDYKRAKSANERLDAANKNLMDTNERLGNQNLDAANKLTLANIDLDTARAKYNQLEKDVDELEEQRETLLQQRETLLQQRETFWMVSQQLSAGEISFRGGQVLVESSFPANLGLTETQHLLGVLIERGREVVKATKTPDGTERSLELILPVEGGTSISEAEIVQQVSNYLALLNSPASVRLIIAMNHAKVDPIIYANVRVVPIETKFVRDETIATGTIDGSLGDAAIFNQLLELVNKGEEIARGQKGIDPVPTAEAPFFYANGTNERIFEALHKIQATGKKVSVRLVATRNITTVDQLQVRFEVEAPPDEPSPGEPRQD